jgi:hypothetical protein
MAASGSILCELVVASVVFARVAQGRSAVAPATLIIVILSEAKNLSFPACCSGIRVRSNRKSDISSVWL